MIQVLLNDSVTITSIKYVENLNISNRNIFNLTGIEHFASLKKLYCGYNNISSLNLSNNTNLSFLDCSNNLLTQLDLHNNTFLQTVYCSYNKLIDLDLSSNSNLTYINCNHNELTGINVRNGNNSNLQLDARYNPELFCIQVDDASASYNWYKNAYTAYSENCSGYVAEMTYIPDDNFERALADLGLDTGELNDSVPTIAIKNLKGLNVSYKNITDLTGIEDFVALEQLYCYNNQISAINLKTATNLKVLQIQNNKLSDLDLSLNPFLNSFDASNNQLTGLNLRNGNNTNMSVNVQYNPDLLCIQVDDEVATYTYSNWYRDYLSGYSEDCSNYKMEMIYVPDDNFEQALINRSLDFGELNDSVPLHVLTYLKELDIRYCNISNLSGIEKCKSLISLKCWGNNIDSLDLSANSKLKELYCYNNNISKLVLGLNNNLTQITCSNNKITELDLTRTPSLITLNIEMNKIIELDLSQNIALTSLKANYNQLSGLNLKNGNNHNLSLEVTYNPNLFCIEVDDPQSAIQNSNWYKNGYAIYSEDCTSYKPEMTYVPDNNFEQELINQLLDYGPLNDSVPTAGISSISNLTIDSEEIFDLTGIEHFSSLEFLNCNSNPISSIDVSSNIKLKYLECQNCQIKSLNVDKNLLLETLICSQNKIASLDLTSNSLLRFLWCNNNYLQNLDLSSNMLLTGIHCHLNVLTNINLQNGNNHKITYFKADGNLPVCILVDDIDEANSYPDWQIDSWSNYSLDCSNHHLDMVYIPDDNFEKYLIEEKADFGEPNDSVPLAKILNISNVNVNNRNITDLTGIEEFINIDALSCSNNQIKNLDLSSNPLLRIFSCDNNQLESLIINNNPELTFFDCNNNQLTNLDISSNKKLYNLNCSNNKLSKIDVSGKSNLTFFYCSNNNLLNLILNDYYGIIVDATNNPNLFCIEYKNPTQAGNNSKWKKDKHASYSENCTYDLRKTYIPDDNFEQALIDLGYDLGELDDSVLTANIKSVINLNIANKNISDLTGIEYFESLTSLICSLNQLTKLNLNKNRKLDYLECGSNNLDSLNVDSLNLTHISCNSNNLSQLEIKNSTDLIYLYCPFNSLKTIDLSNNKLLEELTINSNKLIELDLSLHTNLSKVFLFDNELTMLNLQNGSNQSISFLDVSNNPYLSCIQIDNVQEANSFVDWYKDSWANYSEDCSKQDIRKTYIPDDNFEQALIDLGYDSGELNDSVLTANIKSVINLNIANKNISDLTGIEYFESLTSLICSLNQLTKLNLNKNKKLDFLECGSNNLDSLNVDSLNLTHISCSYNNLSQLEIKNSTDLIYLYCPFNSLKTIDLSNNKLLKELTISSNKLIELDLSLHTNLSKVFLFDNELTMLNLQNGSNQSISFLDVSNNPNLSCIQIDNVQEANSFVGWYKDSWANYSEDCSSQDIRKTYIPDDNFEQALIDLGYDSGELDDSISTAIITNITYLNVQGKDIMSLQGIEDMENLTYLNCTDNLLTTLDLSNNSKLNSLYCVSNHLYSLNLQNGNNRRMTGDYGHEINIGFNPDLTCIQVDDAFEAETYSRWFRSSQMYFSENCESVNDRIPVSEYEALNALYNSLDGENWSYNYNWLDTINHVVDDWYGITVENGHVTQIYLDHTNTLGFIPKELGNLTELRKLHLRYCGLSGGIPVELSNLKKLEYLNLSDGHLGPQFIDGVPNQVRCIPDELENLDSLTYFNIDFNKFMFNDIEAVYSWKNFNNFKFIYRAQYTSTMGYNEVWVEPGKDIVISIYDYIAGPSDQYQWVKDNVWISGANSRTLELKNVQLSDEGSYYCRITNSVAQEATISSSNTDLKVKGLLVAGVPQLEYNSLVDLYFSTQGENWTTNTNWLDATRSVDTWFGITVEDGHVTQIQLNNNNLQNTAFEKMIYLPKLKWLDLGNNKLTGFNFQGTDSLVSLDTFLIDNNQLIFEDLIPAFSTLNYPNFSKQFNYSPQAKIGTTENIIKMTDENFSVEIAEQFLSPNDQFQWYKEYSPLEGETNSDIDFFPVSTSDSGSYHLQITNPYVPNLTLYSELIHIGVTNSLIDSLLLFDLTEKYPQLKTIWDNNDPFSTWPGVTFENGKVTTLNLSGLQLEGDFSSFFTDFDSLKWLDLSNNKLSGEFPKIGAINNSTIKSNGINNQHLKYLDISNNNFVFAELEPAFDFFQTIDTFIYAPQSMVGLPFDTTIYKNQPLTFKIANYTPGSFDSYSWSKNGIEITDANEFTFAIKNAATGDSGYYTCAITNLIFPELTLLSDTSRLNVLIPVGIDDFNNTHFNIYPNPAEKQIFVETGNKPVNLKIFDIVGKLFFEKESFISGWINIEPFTSGIYFVRITSQNSETITKKVIFK